mmetsp:Transcript_24857/g.40238  ORF Transcript_24857/g.40238 Transcript_24857/m.40238 type:complete len:235 (+) Transcript_24857:966-1670(+)
MIVEFRLFTKRHWCFVIIIIIVVVVIAVDIVMYQRRQISTMILIEVLVIGNRLFIGCQRRMSVMRRIRLFVRLLLLLLVVGRRLIRCRLWRIFFAIASIRARMRLFSRLIANIVVIRSILKLIIGILVVVVDILVNEYIGAILIRVFCFLLGFILRVAMNRRAITRVRFATIATAAIRFALLIVVCIVDRSDARRYIVVHARNDRIVDLAVRNLVVLVFYVVDAEAAFLIGTAV